MLSDFSIVRPDRFIQATRSSGYKSTAAALAELVDNSLEANATRIEIKFVQEAGGDKVKKGAKSKQRITAVVVRDNGDGMSAETLRRSLSFGDGTRFNSRVSLGRFGMGLPNASVSQAKRVEVHSWQNGSPPLWTYLDVEEVAEGTITKIPEPKRKAIPAEYDLFESTKGTVVVWTRCEFLDSFDPEELARMIRTEFGRIYRYFLASNISIVVHGVEIRPLDPLFLMPEARIDGDPIAEQHGETITIPIPLDDEGKRTSDVTVRFSLLPAVWQREWGGQNPPKAAQDELRKRGIMPSKRQKQPCISVVRANREIDFLPDLWRADHWTARWYRAEIRFQPDLDEYFGVTHTKQGARLKFGSMPENKLREFMNGNLSTLKAKAQARSPKSEGAIDATQAETLMKRVKDRLEPIAELDGKSSADALVEVSSYVRRMAVNRGWDDQTRVAAEQQLASFPVKFETEQRFESPFYRVESVGHTTIVWLNKDHAFYQVLSPQLESDSKAKTSIQLLIAALALGESTAKDTEAMKKWYREQCAKWSGHLKMFLDEWSEEEADDGADDFDALVETEALASAT